MQMHRPGGPGFFDWEGIEEGYGQIQDRLERAGHLRGASRGDFVTEATENYNAVNTVHAFREGNGRTQREWVSDLAREAGFELGWERVHGFTNDVASQRAREGDLTQLRQVFETITTRRGAPSVPEAAQGRGSTLRPRQNPASRPEPRSRDSRRPPPREPAPLTHGEPRVCSGR